MPTGYTHLINEGKQTTKQYIMSCARNFGYLAIMRDIPSDAAIPDKFEPDTYHKGKIDEYQLELDKFHTMADDDIQEEIDKTHQTRIDNRNKYTLSKLEIKDRYESALNEIKKWNIPSSEHKNLKDFCISQLEDSIKYDCNMSYIETIPKKESISEWKKNRNEKLNEDIAYHRENWNKEVARTNERNIWIKQLRDSLDNL